MMTFALHPRLASKTFLIDLPLCRILLQDEHHYPWLFLVPRKPDACRTMDLTPLDQIQLIQEIDFVQKVMWEEFKPAQLNMAALGNKIPQLHIHIIARFENDPAWPNTVWDHPLRLRCDETLKNSRAERLQFLLSNFAHVNYDTQPF